MRNKQWQQNPHYENTDARTKKICKPSAQNNKNYIGSTALERSDGCDDGDGSVLGGGGGGGDGEGRGALNKFCSSEILPLILVHLKITNMSSISLVKHKSETCLITNIVLKQRKRLNGDLNAHHKKSTNRTAMGSTADIDSKAPTIWKRMSRSRHLIWGPTHHHEIKEGSNVINHNWNTDGSFTGADSNLFLSHILPIDLENKYLGMFKGNFLILSWKCMSYIRIRITSSGQIDFITAQGNKN